MQWRTVWKVSKYGPEKTPYLDTCHAVKVLRNIMNLPDLSKR